MAICPYCGKSAGFFSRYHDSCFQQAQKDQNASVQEITSIVRTIAIPDLKAYLSPVQAGDEIRNIASRHNLPSDVVANATLAAVDELSREEPLAFPMYEWVNLLCENVVGDPNTISHVPMAIHCNQVLLNAALSHTLWLVMHGQSVASRLPSPSFFVLQPGESRVAQFGTVLYRKNMTLSSHAGGYNGLSVRLASGLYYRFGRYSGHSAPEQVQNLDNGVFELTDRAMYFGGQQAFRVPYASLLRFNPYPDGLGFFRSVGDGREESFLVVDVRATFGVASAKQLPPDTLYNPANATGLPVGWFLYNAVMFFTRSLMA